MSDPNIPAGHVADEAVRGERTTAIVHAARSAQSRVSSLLATGLMITLGLSALGWYYGHAMTRVTRARQQAQSAVTSRAQGEMPLPWLGRIEPPVIFAAAAAAPPKVVDAPLEPTAAEVRAEPVPQERVGAATPSAPGGAAEVRSTTPSRGELALARRLSGGVLSRDPDAATHASSPPLSPVLPAPATAAASPTSNADPAATASADRGSLAALLRAPLTRAIPAALLPTQRLLLPEGAFIDCTLETAIDSTLPGMTTCITPADTFGADGKVVLLERGTKLVGETRGEVRQGQARVFVLWTQARTPTGVVVPLASPGTDELGRSGLPGEVDRHFWQRFGAAMLITLIDGAVQAGVQASARNGGTVIYAPSTSQDVLTEVLKDTVAIPPTVIKHQGDRIQVLVARDLDFRPVYELRAADAGP